MLAFLLPLQQVQRSVLSLIIKGNVVVLLEELQRRRTRHFREVMVTGFIEELWNQNLKRASWIFELFDKGKFPSQQEYGYVDQSISLLTTNSCSSAKCPKKPHISTYGSVSCNIISMISWHVGEKTTAVWPDWGEKWAVLQESRKGGSDSAGQ